MRFLKSLFLPALILAACMLFLPMDASAASGACGPKLTWQLDKAGILTISGTGPMDDFNWKNYQPWDDKKYEIKKIIIKEGVTTIGDLAFEGFRNLTSVTIAEGVTSIGESAFEWCDALTDISLPSSLTEIGQMAFYQCLSVKTLRIPQNVTSIGDNAFRLSGLTEVTIPGGVVFWGVSTFEECYDLRYVTIEEGITTIPASTFMYDELTWIEIPASVTAIEDHAFCSYYVQPHVYYGGTQEKWATIAVGEENYALENAILHFPGEKLPGDIDKDGKTTTDDAVYLLLHIMFGAGDYPIPADMTIDLNGDGAVETNDAVYLLLHVMFGAKDYPLYI